jgi:hypothetical protein
MTRVFKAAAAAASKAAAAASVAVKIEFEPGKMIVSTGSAPAETETPSLPPNKIVL